MLNSIRQCKLFANGTALCSGRLPATLREERRRLEAWAFFVFILLAKKPMRLLIYGFGPYRHFQENISEKILRKLPRRRWLKKVVFPVKFDKAQFVKVITEYKTDIILGLGQCSRGKRLRIEAMAVNKKRNSKREKPRPIVQGGARRLLTNLKLNGGRQARFSDNAGDYVCNYSMYVILDFLKRRRLPSRFGFIHIPHRYELKKAVRILVKVIDQIGAGHQLD